MAKQKLLFRMQLAFRRLRSDWKKQKQKCGNSSEKLCSVTLTLGQNNYLMGSTLSIMMKLYLLCYKKLRSEENVGCS
jgi:hypothetical protein